MRLQVAALLVALAASGILALEHPQFLLILSFVGKSRSYSRYEDAGSLLGLDHGKGSDFDGFVLLRG